MDAIRRQQSQDQVGRSKPEQDRSGTSPPAAHGLLRLQALAGNRAVQRIIAVAQARERTELGHAPLAWPAGTTVQRVLDPAVAAQSRAQIQADIEGATVDELREIIATLAMHGAPRVPAPHGEITIRLLRETFDMDEADIDPLLAQARDRLERLAPAHPHSQETATTETLTAAVDRIDRIRELEQLRHQILTIGAGSGPSQEHELTIGEMVYTVPNAQLTDPDLLRAIDARAVALDASLNPGLQPPQSQTACESGPLDPANDTAARTDLGHAAPSGFELVRDIPFPPLTVPTQWCDIEFTGRYQIAITFDREPGGWRFRLGLDMPTLHFGPIDLMIRLNLVENARGRLSWLGPSATASARTVWIPLSSDGMNLYRARIDATFRPNWVLIREWMEAQYPEAGEIAASGELGGAGVEAGAAGGAEAGGVGAEATTAMGEGEATAAGGEATVAEAGGAEAAELGLAGTAEVLIPAAIIAAAVYGIYVILTGPHPEEDLTLSYVQRLHDFAAAYAARLAGRDPANVWDSPAVDAGFRLAEHRIAQLQAQGMSLRAIHENAGDTAALYDRVFDAALPYFQLKFREQWLAEGFGQPSEVDVELVGAYRGGPRL